MDHTVLIGDGDPRQALSALAGAIVCGTKVHWERLLAISYATLVLPGSNILDVGCKKGRHVAVFLDSLRAERVYAFEPNPRMAQILRRQFARHPNLTIIEAALADYTGVEEFIVNQGAPGESGLRQRVFSDPDRAHIERILVPVTRLDEQAFEGPIHYIKIDVEGGEIGVLRGGRDVLARDRPIISVEYGRSSYSAYGHTADTLFEEASFLGYAICDLFGNIFSSIEAWRACVDRLYWDYLMIPEERLDATAEARAKIRDRAAAELRWQARLRALADQVPFLATLVDRRLKRVI